MSLENRKDTEKEAMKIDMPEERGKSQKSVEELLEVLISYNMESNAQSINLLMNYMNEMEDQFTAVMEELADVREQLANVKDTPQNQNVKSTLTSLSEKLHEKLNVLQEQIATIRATLNEKAAQIVENVKDAGITALNNVCEVLGIKDTMQKMKHTFEQNAAEMQDSMDKIDTVSTELRETTTHAKNIARAMAGKEVKETPQAKESGFFHAMKKPYQSMKNVCDRQSAKLEKAIFRMEHLEQSAEKVSDKRTQAKADTQQKKPSIMQKLRNYKEEQGEKDKAEPVQAKAKKQEAAL